MPESKSHPSEILSQLVKAQRSASAISAELETGKVQLPLSRHFESLQTLCRSNSLRLVMIPTNSAVRALLITQLSSRASSDASQVTNESGPETTALFWHGRLSHERDVFVTAPLEELLRNEGWLPAIAPLANVVLFALYSDQQLPARTETLWSEVPDAETWLGILWIAKEGMSSTGPPTGQASDRAIAQLLWRPAEETLSEAVNRVFCNQQMIQLLRMRFIARWLGVGVHMLRECVLQEINLAELRGRQIAVRLAQIDRKEWEQDLREFAAHVRRRLDEWLAAAETELSATHRKRIAPRSPIFNRLDRQLEETSPEDLDEEPSFRTIRLRPRPAILSRFTNFLRANLEKEVTETRQTLDDLCGQLDAGIQKTFRDCEHPAMGHSWQLPGPKSLVGTDLLDQLVWPVTQCGEIPKRGLKDRFMQGYRPISMAFMLIMLVGGVMVLGAGELRKFLAIPLLVLFLAGFGWTFHSFRKEAREQKLDHLQRFRDMLRDQGRRLYEVVHREWYSRQQSWIRDHARSVQKALDNHVRAAGMQRAEQSAAERQATQQHLRLNEQAYRDWMARLQQIHQIETVCADAHVRLIDAAVSRIDSSEG